MQLTTMFAWIGVCTSLVCAQEYCASTRFSDSLFALSQLQRDTGLAYGYATDWQGRADSLRMDVYYPKKNVDLLTKRPIVLCVHGGGFLTGSRSGYQSDCIEYAKNGFVAASIDYRLGWDTGPGGASPGQCLGDTVSQAKAIYRAYQDTRAALRFLSHNALRFGMDTSFVILDGGSAGAVTVLGVAFMDQTEVDARMSGMHAALGALDSSTNNLRAGYRVRTVISRWGALPDTMNISSGEEIPVMFFHGSNDQVVPYDVGTAHNCPGYARACGSASLSRRLTTLGVCNQLYTETCAGHGVTNQAYILPLSTCFVKAVMCGSCVSTSAEYGPSAGCGSVSGVLPPQSLARPNPESMIREIGQFDIFGREIGSPVSGSAVLISVGERSALHLVLQKGVPSSRLAEISR